MQLEKSDTEPVQVRDEEARRVRDRDCHRQGRCNTKKSDTESVPPREMKLEESEAESVPPWEKKLEESETECVPA